MVTLTTVMSSTYIQSERMQTCQKISFTSTINAIHPSMWGRYNTRHFIILELFQSFKWKLTQLPSFVIYRTKRCEDFELIFLFQMNAVNDIDLLMLLISNSEQHYVGQSEMSNHCLKKKIQVKLGRCIIKPDMVKITLLHLPKIDCF